MNGMRTMALLALVLVAFVSLPARAAGGSGPNVPGSPAAGVPVPVPEAVARRAVEKLRAETLVTPPAAGRSGLLVRRLASLGPSAGPALLDVVRADGGMGLGDDPARRVFVAAAAEALGQARLPEAAPAFRAVLEGPGDDPRIARAAAAGLGRLCGDGEVAYLASLAVPGGRRAAEAVAGLGYCRRRPAAVALVSRLAAAPDADAARALGNLGSSWAWVALGESRRAEGEAIRGEIARALVAALPGSEGELRTELGRAILMVKAPETEALLAAAKAAHPGEAAALDALGERLAKNR
jgi:hypothetical protein